MPRISPTLSATTVAVTLGLSLVAVAPATAAKKKAPAAAKTPATKTVTACVNKKSGTTKVLLGKKAKKKCAKGWTKMTWNVGGTNGSNGTNGINGANGINGTNGAAGVTGANGEQIAVHDEAGNRIGTFAGMGVVGVPIPIVQVLGDDGGLYPYLESGQYLPMFSALGSTSAPYFRDAACAGTAYISSEASSWNGLLSKFVGGSLRFGFRASTGPGLDLLGPARVWKLTTTTSVLPGPVPTLYTLGFGGACTTVDPADPTSPDPGYLLVTLESVPAPPDGVGRLTIG